MSKVPTTVQSNGSQPSASLASFADPTQRKTAHQYVLEAVRGAILGGALPRGARLVQLDLAQSLGVSVTPVREALRDLATEGLVAFDAHRGALVRRLDIGEVRELYELRMTLEPLMARRVITTLTPANLAQAEELRGRMNEPCDYATWADLNHDFHAIFSEPDDSTRLASILAGLRDSAAPYVALSLSTRPEQLEEANVEHTKLLDLYSRGVIDEIVAVTLTHLRSTLAAIEAGHVLGHL